MMQIGLSWNLPDMIIGLIVFLLTFFGTIAIVAIVLVRLPPDYFAPGATRPFMLGRPWPLRWIGLFAKNALGVLVIAIGVVLSLPGMPGQGILMLVLGLMLLDIPGKKKIVHRITRIPRVIATINALRARYGKAPLKVD